MNVISNLLRPISLPRMVRMRQRFAGDHIQNVYGETRRSIERFAQAVRPGMRVAIAGGSRGIANIPDILRAVADLVKEGGGDPFIFPAMGSHGGATADGQRDVLTSLGITEAACGCPIISSMDTVQIAVSPENTPVYIDQAAARADAIVLVNRIKPHPMFMADYESGLMKMASIGLAKQRGAELFHQAGIERFHRLIPLHGSIVLEKCKVLFGLGIIENAYDQTCGIAALAPEEIATREPGLLLEAKARMPRILPGKADVLVVDKMGKDISGDGMDPHITGRFSRSYTGKPNFSAKRLVVLDLTDATKGNFIGIDAADVTTRRVIDKADIQQTYPNSLTSCCSQHMPMHMRNDREAVQCAIKIAPGIDRDRATIIRIADTLHLSEIRVSENMMEAMQGVAGLERIGEPEDWAFDAQGNLW